MFYGSSLISYHIWQKWILSPQACASGVWWLSRLGMYSCKGKFHWHSLKMHTAAPVSRPVGTQKSSVSSFKKKKRHVGSRPAWFRWLLRPRKKRTKHKKQKKVAEMWGKDANALILHALDLKGFHQIHDNFSSRRWNTHLRRICLRILQLGTSTNCPSLNGVLYGHMAISGQLKNPLSLELSVGSSSLACCWNCTNPTMEQLQRTSSGDTSRHARHPVTTKWSFIVLRTEALFENVQRNAKQTCVECWTRGNPTWACTCLAAVKVTYCSLSLSRKTTRQVQVDKKTAWFEHFQCYPNAVGMKAVSISLGINKWVIMSVQISTTHPPLNSGTSSMAFSRDAMDPGGKEGWFRVKHTCAKNVDEYRNNARRHLELQVSDEEKKTTQCTWCVTRILQGGK